MWPFSKKEDDPTTRERLANLERDVLSLGIDMDQMRDKVLRKIQVRKAKQLNNGEDIKQGGIIKPSELKNYGSV